jgi:2-octaprenyl-6-methoxyphenol hydroxylase
MERYDVIILGSGLVGLTLGIALESAGLTVATIDAMPPEAALDAGFDGRASAIASASWRMLDTLGVADVLRPYGCAIHRIEVRDGLQRDALDFTTAPEDDPLGTMVENRVLRRVLHERAGECGGLTRYAPVRVVDQVRDDQGATVTLDTGQVLMAPLIVVAEGRNSESRSKAGIRVAKWSYDHTAIISAFDHTRPHDNIAHEIFYSAGPFALLPLQPGTRSALVWTVAAKDAPGVLALSDRAFLHEIEKKSGGLLGKASLAAPRSSYPLGFHHTATITAQRLALVGDAGHGIHPIAGQGLNLGFRDAAALAEVLVDGARTGLDLGDAQLLARYENWRSIDALSVAMATDTLTRLFGLPGRPASAVRRFGLGAVQRIAPLKQFFMSEARGETGALPRMLQGVAV